MEKNDSMNFNDVNFETTDEKRVTDGSRFSTKDRPSADEVQTIIKDFLHNFSRQYPEPGPLQVSFIGPLDEALNHSLFESTTPRPLILYLHHSQSIAVNIFCQYVLCADTVTDYLAEEFVIWAWNRTLAADCSALLSMLHRYTTKEVATTVASFPIDAYPLLVCLSVHQGQIDIVSVIQGTMSKADTLAQLLESRKKFNLRTELSHSKSVHRNLVLNENRSKPADVLKPLAERSPTIEKLAKDFESSYKPIVRIDPVEDAIWLSKYIEQKKIIDTRLGHDQNEQFLFHGCSRAAAEEIIQRGFDHKLIGMHGTAYGYGFYFSSDHCVSSYYTVPDRLNDGERTMLICRVLVGRTCLGNIATKKCPTGYDSTTDGSTIYVVYSNEQILPEYIVTYKEEYDIYKGDPVGNTNQASTGDFYNLFRRFWRK